MSLKKPKRPRIPYQPKQETVNLNNLIRQYNEIIDHKSTLSSAQRQLVVARIEKLKEAGLVKLQSEIESDILFKQGSQVANAIDAANQPIEEQVAQIIEDNKDPKNIN